MIENTHHLLATPSAERLTSSVLPPPPGLQPDQCSPGRVTPPPEDTGKPAISPPGSTQGPQISD
ncbi:hypothetical protein MDA_GLEAN10004127 [Myotis davidii]|uniref:Uncharacterized protein n=1 Tax=Myotis davidii TaxID=225400 RepID=L5LL50_MYODS|nr:hypothetical protein MDA_GLEAN10004127 [Myotis davidii]